MNISITQFPPQGAPAWYRTVEQVVTDLEARIFKLEQEIAQLRNQVGNFPVDPNVTLP